MSGGSSSAFLGRIVTALVAGGLGLVLGGAAASRLGIEREAVPWVAIAVAIATFLGACGILFRRRPRSRS
ncbi:MAG: hypothetical protein IRZ04_09695 [Rhodospirillales bacterium]|nr:hypothetical protein [Rhodospirillales bacterium]